MSRMLETKQLQQAYWSAFGEYAKEHASVIKPTKPLFQHWMNIALGRSGFKLVVIASTWSSETESYEA